MTRRQRSVLGLLAANVAAVYVILALLTMGDRFALPVPEGHPWGTELPQEQKQPSEPERSATVAPLLASISSPTPLAARATQAPATPSPRPVLPPTPTEIKTGAAVDFLSDYLQNRTYAGILEARPWTNTSLNVWQYAQPLGGVSLWDYFATKFGQGFDEEWSSSRYGWRDDNGQWQRYRTEMLRDVRGQAVTGYVLVDRHGPGVMDKMVFTMYSVGARPADRDPDLPEWGYLSHLGRLRVEVDDRLAYDVPIEEWFSGAALCLPPDLARLLFWRYRDFGSNGSIVPIPYARHLKLSVYGGIEKPKWFTLTGVTLPGGTPVQPLAGCLDAAARATLAALAPNITAPETYPDRLNGPVETRELVPRAMGQTASDSAKSSDSIKLDGAGTITALQFRVPRNRAADVNLRVLYGGELAFDIPLMAFFGDQDRTVKHRSTPLGIVDDPADPSAYLFYCNYPLPYQNGMTIELTTRAQPFAVRVRYARTTEVTNTQFRVLYDDWQSHPMLAPLGPDYSVRLPGNGKLVGAVLVTRDFRYDARTIPAPPPDQVQGATVFPMGYMESNVTFRDGRGVVRVYSGLEDFADGGYDFDSDQGPGVKNLFFAGVLAFSLNPRERGFFTLFRYWNDLSAFRFRDGLTLSFQHGTWQNNYALRYGLTAFYYTEVSPTR